MISDQLSRNYDPHKSLEFNNNQGLFCLFNEWGDVIHAIVCRNALDKHLNLNTEVIGFFAKGKMDIQGVNHFFEEFIEERLNIKNSLVFHVSTITDLMIVEIGPFWRKDIVRLNLLTLLLRCAVIYSQETLDESLESYELTKQSKQAILYFLEGNIFPTFDKWTQGKNGFVSEFSGQSMEDLSKKLTYLEIKPTEYFLQEH